MKFSSSSKELKKRHQAVMWVCFLYGGFAIILFLFDIYTIIWSGAPMTNEFNKKSSITDINNKAIDTNRPNFGEQRTFSPMRIITSPFSIMNFFSGLIAIVAGFTIMSIIKEKEIKIIKQQAADQFLLPDEKKVIEVLKKNDYSLTQSKITKESGLNKVQVHRVIKRLEYKGLIEKHDFGLTNKIVLKKEYFE